MKRRSSLGNSARAAETPEKAKKKLSTLVGLVAKKHHESLVLRETLTKTVAEQTAVLSKIEQNLESNAEPLSLKHVAQLEKELKSAIREFNKLQKAVDEVSKALDNSITPEMGKQTPEDLSSVDLSKQVQEIAQYAQEMRQSLQRFDQARVRTSTQLTEKQSLLEKAKASDTLRTLAENFKRAASAAKDCTQDLQTIETVSPPLTPRTLLSLKEGLAALQQVKDLAADFPEHFRISEIEQPAPLGVKKEVLSGLDEKVQSLHLEA